MVLRLLCNRVTGFMIVFAVAYLAAVRTGFSELLDPLFGLGLGLILYRNLSRRLALIPWMYAAIQLALAFQVPITGALSAILLMSCGYVLILPPTASNAAWNTRFGDIRMRPSEIHNIRIDRGIGDIRIDLSSCFVPPGEHLVGIERLAGNVVVYVPCDLEVKVEGKLLFGKAELPEELQTSRYPQQLRFQSDNYTKAENRLRITVSTVVGDVKVRYL